MKKINTIYHNLQERIEIVELIKKLECKNLLVDYTELRYCDSLYFGEFEIKFNEK